MNKHTELEVFLTELGYKEAYLMLESLKELSLSAIKLSEIDGFRKLNQTNIDIPLLKSEYISLDIVNTVNLLEKTLDKMRGFTGLKDTRGLKIYLDSLLYSSVLEIPAKITQEKNKKYVTFVERENNVFLLNKPIIDKYKIDVIGHVFNGKNIYRSDF